jgi:hypothetical protein
MIDENPYPSIVHDRISSKNTLIVTHFPNILEAYPTEAAGVADGESFDPSSGRSRRVSIGSAG